MDYVHLMLPMEFEIERALPDRDRVQGSSVRTTGELLDPLRFPADAVARAQGAAWAAMPIAGQYQQRPAPRSGGMFQRSDFEIVDAVPASAQAMPGVGLRGSEGKAGQAAGLDRRAAHGAPQRHVLRRGRGARPLVARRGRDEALKNIASHDGLTVPIRMPQDPGSAGKSDAATKVKLLAGYDVKVLPVTGDKATRAKPASAQAEAGNVKLVKGRLERGVPRRDLLVPERAVR